MKQGGVFASLRNKVTNVKAMLRRYLSKHKARFSAQKDSHLL